MYINFSNIKAFSIIFFNPCAYLKLNSYFKTKVVLKHVYASLCQTDSSAEIYIFSQSQVQSAITVALTSLQYFTIVASGYWNGAME